MPAPTIWTRSRNRNPKATTFRAASTHRCATDAVFRQIAMSANNAVLLSSPILLLAGNYPAETEIRARQDALPAGAFLFGQPRALFPDGGRNIGLRVAGRACPFQERAREVGRTRKRRVGKECR